MSLHARGLFEAHLAVRDVDRSLGFYRALGLELAYEAENRGAAFLWVGGPGESMLGLWSTGTMPMGIVQHIAFSASLEDVLCAPETLAALDIPALSFFGEPTSEPSVIAWMPAAAIYFTDPDGHLVELLAMLDEPPRSQLGVIPLSSWTA
jgi:lactoylglutathione lyase